MQPGPKRYTANLHNSCAFKTFVGQPRVGEEHQHHASQPDLYANSRISQIQFQMLKDSDVTRCSHLEVINRSFYHPDRQIPISWGPLDTRFGCSSKDTTCGTCHKKLSDCIGHFGHISLALPVFHIGFVKDIQKVLQAICKKCSNILLPNDNFRQYFLARMRNADRRARTNLRDEILDIAKRCKVCVHCGSRNGQIKKLPGMLKIIHDLRARETKKDRDNFAAKMLQEKEVAKLRRKQRNSKDPNNEGSTHTIIGHATTVSSDSMNRFVGAPTTWKEEFYNSFTTAIEYNSQISDFLDKAVLEISPLLALKLFTNISNEDCMLLNLDPFISRPEDMIITQMTVPPVCIRPSVAMGASGSNEDDLTVKLGDIVFVSNFIKDGFNRGVATGTLIENWNYLQLLVAMYINSDLPGFSKANLSGKPIRALTQRLKGKTGRFRGNLSGKRVDFSSRTVISPDPNLRVDQVGVPVYVAKVLTFPERVFEHNIKALKRAIINGPDVHPGANIVEFSTGDKVFLKYADRVKIANMIKVGDIVERHLHDNDVVLFNRQPSLHRMSIMAHRAKVLQWRTFRFNECVCAPYNADFDGDEMNLHLPQTLEAKAEAEQLMSVMNNLVTPRNGEPLIHATQDFITASFLITSKDRFLNKGQFCYLASGMSDALDNVTVPVPALIKPMTLWTGKQLFSLLIRPNTDANESEAVQPWPIISIELKAKNNTRLHCMDPVDGYVVVRNSELLCGNIDKDALGGSKKGMYYQIIRSGPVGNLNAARFLNRLAKFSARYISCYGFSIGIDDVTPSENLTSKKNILISEGYEQCHKDIKLYETGKLALRPGCDEVQTLESLLLGELSAIREDAGSVCFKDLNILYNTPLIMAVSGSKGSKINISQMTACVGQQAISGSRIPEGFHLRTLPHFPKFSREPEAKGFVANSFYTGLIATEFFFHTMGGREGLVDTAVKTAETGYMQRRLMKALEDLCVQYDGSVRTSENNIIQFKYGDDGLDPVLMANGVLAVNFPIYFEQCRSVCSSLFNIHNTYTTVTQKQIILSSLLPKHQLDDAVAPHKCIAEEDITICTNDRTMYQDWVGFALSTYGKTRPHTTGSGSNGTLGNSNSNSNALLFTQDKLKSEFIITVSDVRKKQLDAPSAFILPHELLIIVQAFCSHSLIQHECTTKFTDALLEYIVSECNTLWKTFELYGFTQEQVVTHANAGTLDIYNPDQSVTLREVMTLLEQTKPVYKAQVNIFLNGCFGKYVASSIEPGTAVGAIGGQSIGEPGTQMTLKTFHFAGVASMNITLGVPRIKEIINAAKKINTPIITAYLENDSDEKSARIVKGRIETTKLGEICTSIEAVFNRNKCYIRIELDLDTITKLQLNITSSHVATVLDKASKLKLKGKVHAINDHVIEIDPPQLQLSASRGTLTSANASSVLQSLNGLKQELSGVIVNGITTVSRAVINDDGGGKYHLLVEGYDLLSVMTTVGVKSLTATSNHIMEIWKTLGIEAARSSIMNEINTTMDSHGLNVDPRHSALLADIMTYRGEILGITRFGIAKMKESVLMLASFEKTADHLFEAALRGTTDNINGVSECIIMGTPMPVGTGLFNLVQSSQLQVAPDVKDYEKSLEALKRKGKSRDAVSVLNHLQVMKEKEQAKLARLHSNTKSEEKSDPNTSHVTVKPATAVKKEKTSKVVVESIVTDVVEKDKSTTPSKYAQVDPFAKRSLLMNNLAKFKF